MKYCIISQLDCSVEGRVVLPAEKNWDDIQEWYVKWDTLHVLFKGEKEFQEFCLNSYLGDGSIDWKRPDSISVYAENEDGDADYDDEIDGK